MPLLKRKAVQAIPVPELLKDNHEVFVCEITGEIFSNYDDFFKRTMLLCSTVWSCAMTGRSNLTYIDALESEKCAKRTLKTFPTALKGPILLIASHTKRTAIHDLASDVHGYAKDVFFKGETVYTKTDDPETIRKAKIVRVVINDDPRDQIPSRLIYHVESIDKGTPANYSVRGEAIIRERNCLSREKCKLFLKQHVELGANQMLCVKQTSLEQFVTSKDCTEDKVFYGQKPDFKVSKKLQLQDKAREESVQASKKSKKPRQKHAKLNDKENKRQSKNKKQSSIDKYLKQPSDESVEAKKGVMKKNEMAHLEELAEKKELAKKRTMLEKTLLVAQVALAHKEYNSIREDLELTDQRVIPPAREVRTLIGEENFPDFIFILEFLNTFGDLLSIENKFQNGVSMEQLERALLLREMDGPLSDILQVLLSALFVALTDAAVSEESSLEPGAMKLIKWCKKKLSMNITDLPIDSTTVSELLRLHLIAQNQPTSCGDTSFKLNRVYQDIIQLLTTHTVFQLPTKSVMQIICSLIYQLLMTDEVLSRVEKVGEARIKIKNNLLEQRRLTQKTTSLNQIARENLKKELASKMCQLAKNEIENCRNEMEHKRENYLEKIDKDANTKMQELHDELEALKQNYGLYQVYLGTDRAFRNYWQFQSLPGLFVEHDTKFTGCCMEQVTKNIPGLAKCEQKMRKKYITDSILRCAGNSNGLVDIDANGNLKCVDDVYEQLLYRGSSLLEQGKTRKNNPFLVVKANVSTTGEDDTAGSKIMDTPETNNGPDKCPSNRELLMCTGDEKNCPVHSSNHQRAPSWSYYATAHELDALIYSLNQRGLREKPLRVTLELYRDIIVSHMDKCPIANLSIPENDRPMLLANMVEPQRKKNDIFPQDPDIVRNEILETMFRENLLDLEYRITVGCLGELKVNSVEKWREAILNRSYDSQITGQLQWGRERLRNDKYCYVKIKNQESSSSESEEEEHLFQPCTNVAGCNLPKTESKDGPTQSQLATIDPFQEKVRSLASALLQIAQSVDPKFLRHPFGPKGTCKDRNTIMQWQHYGLKRLVLWETSLMQATSISQLFLHYHILYDAIRWSRSIERAVCMVCRLKGDASVTLLCDECNRACHMYCLKPKLKQIPEGDWFCMQCRPEDHAPKHSTGARKRIQINNYNESSESEGVSQNPDDDDSDGNQSDVTKDDLESEDDTSSSVENNESTEVEEDDEWTVKGLKAKIVLSKKATVKKVDPQTVSKQTVANVNRQESQRKPPKRSRQLVDSRQAGPSKKSKSSDITRPSAERRSLRRSGRR